MSSISFTQLEVQKRTNRNSYQLIMNFDVEPTPDPKNPSVNLQYAIYDEYNQLLTTMVLGKRSYTIGSGVYPKITTTSKKVRVDAWLTGDTLVRTYDVLTTTGAKEFNIISNIVSHTLSLTSGTGFKRGQAYQAPITEEVEIEAAPGVTVDSIVSGLTQAVTYQEAAAEPLTSVLPPPTLSQETQKIINNFPNAIKKSTFQNNIDWLLQGLIDEATFLRAYYYLIEQGAITFPEEPEPEQKETWWVTRPSGIIEQVSVTPSGKRKLESIGWKFSKEKPAELEPINADISVIFSSGIGGDLKTHFNFSSLVIDKNIQHELATWIMQNYGTTILLVTNRLTDNPVTHNLQSIKDLIKQKILDDKPEEPDPEPDLTTSTSMVTQKLDYFDIIDGRANGQITFRATSDFNSYYYGKELVTYLQLVNKQGMVIAEKKANVLRFTQTEQDETIHYDEAVGDLEIVYATSTVETHDKRPMAENYEFKIKKDEPPEEEGLPRTDFLAKMGGVLAGSIAIALLLPKRIGK